MRCAKELLALLALTIGLLLIAGTPSAQANVLVNGDFSYGSAGWTFTDVSVPYTPGDSPYSTLDCSHGYADFFLSGMYGRGLLKQCFQLIQPSTQLTATVSMDYQGLSTSDQSIVLWLTRMGSQDMWYMIEGGSSAYFNRVVFYVCGSLVFEVKGVVPASGTLGLAITASQAIAYVNGMEVGRGNLPPSCSTSFDCLGIQPSISNRIEAHILIDNVNLTKVQVPAPVLTLTCPVTQCRTGDYVDFTATLTDSAAHPLSNRTIAFSWNYSGLDPSDLPNFSGSYTGSTDLVGRCELHWFSKWAAFDSPVTATITAVYVPDTGSNVSATCGITVYGIPASLEGYAYKDLNANGVFDPDVDELLTNAQVCVQSQYNSYARCTATDAAGATYSIVVPQCAYNVTLPSYSVSVSIGPADFHANTSGGLVAHGILRYAPPAIEGFVVAGLPEGGEQRVGGATVELRSWNQEHTKWTGAVGSATTGPDGSFAIPIPDVIPGDSYSLVGKYFVENNGTVEQFWQGVTDIKSFPASNIPQYEILLHIWYQKTRCLEDYLGPAANCLFLSDQAFQTGTRIMACVSCAAGANDICDVAKAVHETPDAPGPALTALLGLMLDAIGCSAGVASGCAIDEATGLGQLAISTMIDLYGVVDCLLSLIDEIRSHIGLSSARSVVDYALVKSLERDGGGGVVAFTASPVRMEVDDAAGHRLYRDSTGVGVKNELGYPAWIGADSLGHEFLYLSQAGTGLRLTLTGTPSGASGDTMFSLSVIRPAGGGGYVASHFDGVPTAEGRVASLALSDTGAAETLCVDVRTDGSCGGSVGPDTVARYGVLLPDLSMSSSGVRIEPRPLYRGGSIKISARIANMGGVPADSTVVRFLWDSPDSSGVRIGSDQVISHLGPDSAVTLAQWAGPIGLTGQHTVWVCIDPGGAKAETDKSNNDCSVSVWILGAPATKQLGGALDLSSSLPQTYEVQQGQPNPFSAETCVRYGLPEEAEVRLEVYDVGGRVVRTLVCARMPAGYHEAVWDGTDVEGRRVASGAYFARFEAGGFVSIQKIVVTR